MNAFALPHLECFRMRPGDFPFALTPSLVPLILDHSAKRDACICTTTWCGHCFATQKMEVATSSRDAYGTQRIAARRLRSIVILDLCDVWGFEARDRLCYVHSLHGRFDVDATLLTLEQALGEGFVRVHRCWLAQVARVRALETRHRAHSLLVGRDLGNEGEHIRIPVAREHVSTVRRLLLTGTIGYPARRANR